MCNKQLCNLKLESREKKRKEIKRIQGIAWMNKLSKNRKQKQEKNRKRFKEENVFRFLTPTTTVLFCPTAVTVAVAAAAASCYNSLSISIKYVYSKLQLFFFFLALFCFHLTAKIVEETLLVYAEQNTQSSGIKTMK